MSQLSAECCRVASVAALVVACIDKPAMASEAEKEEWTGGEVLFAGGTDWAKVHMSACYDAFVDIDAKNSVAHYAAHLSQTARGGSSKKQTDQEKMVRLYAQSRHRKLPS